LLLRASWAAMLRRARSTESVWEAAVRRA